MLNCWPDDWENLRYDLRQQQEQLRITLFPNGVLQRHLQECRFVHSALSWPTMQSLPLPHPHTSKSVLKLTICLQLVRFCRFEWTFFIVICHQKCLIFDKYYTLNIYICGSYLMDDFSDTRSISNTFIFHTTTLTCSLLDRCCPVICRITFFLLLQRPK